MLIRAVEGSFESKLGLLQDIVYGHDFDIICLTETWLNDSINDYEILPTGYNIFRHGRVGRIGGAWNIDSDKQLAVVVRNC